MVREIGKRRRKKVTTRGQSLRYIPEEIILNILRRLPIKARGRFRCVSKQWYKWISHDTRRFKLLIKKRETFHGRKYEPAEYSFYSMDQNLELETLFAQEPLSEYYDEVHGLVLCKDGQRTDDSDEETDSAFKEITGEMVGSCNGLVLVEESLGFYLWNPSTGYCGGKIYGINGYSHVDSGLCFDSKNGDYKALMTISNRSDDIYIMVASFKTKTWTRVNFPTCKRVKLITGGQAVNGCLHWLISKKHSRYTIVYFDPTKDKLVNVPTPGREVRGEYKCVYGLCALDGYLCMVCKILNRGKFEILIMKEYGVKESWEILFKFKLRLGCNEMKPLFYTEDKERVLIMTQTEEDSDGYGTTISAFDRNGKLCRDDCSEVFPSNECSTIVYEETCVKPTWV